MKTLTMKTLALAMLISPLCATAALAQPHVAQTEASQDAAVAAAEPAQTAIAAEPQPVRTCLTLTGSRIAAQRNLRAAREGRAERECANGTGRVYSEDDIERTGQRSVADALRSLDTGIR